MTLVNLTPHPVAIYGNRPLEDGPAEVIEPSGTVARVATIDLGTQLGEACSYEFVEYGHVHDLPPRQAGTAYVVSLVVALAARGRDDEQGTMIGCRFLQRVC